MKWFALLSLMLCSFTFAETWTHDSFEDFSRGTFDDGGQNIYVSREGSIRTIHRFDLNQDGHLDLLFNNTHDTRGILPATLATVSRKREMQSQELPVAGSQRVEFADLNKDGHLDVVFCPNPQGVQHPRRFVTIFWGSDDGWTAARSNGILPTHGATAIALVDLDLDSWTDIAVLNAGAWLPGQPQGRVLRVYWGGAQGYLLAKFNDYSGGSALDVLAADSDNDGNKELLLLEAQQLRILAPRAADRKELSNDPVSVALPAADATCLTAVPGSVLIGTSQDKVYVATEANVRIIDAAPASHITTGDLNSDGKLDLVLTNNSISRAAGGELAAATGGEVSIVWGKDEGAFDAQTRLEIPNAIAAAVGRVDTDRHDDLVIAVYQGAESFDAESRVYFGRGRRELGDYEVIPSTGAMDVGIAPAAGAQPSRVVLCNSVGGILNERVPLYLYWGGKDGFDPNNVEHIPFVSGYESSAADLNADGFVDLVAMCSGHMGAAAEGMAELGANIYWGGPDGFDGKARRDVLREHNLFNSNIADLNKDGFLDIILGVFDPAKPGEVDQLIIYFGHEQGYSRERRVALPSPGRSAICTVADFNQDQWLDIAVTSYNKDVVRIFWGDAAGFAESNQQQLIMPTPIEMDTADLNGDGWLDLICGSYSDSVANHHDTGLLIFWGGAEGFTETNAQWLPGYTPLGITVADWDRDNHLDLFFASYHGEISRESLPSYLYWGSGEGFFFKNKTILFNDSAADGLAGDFNSDGLLDLAVANHTTDGDHRALSKVYYNDGKRFTEPKITQLPTVGPHWFWTEDLGHIYHRKFQHSYESPVVTWESRRGKVTLEYQAEVPEGSSLYLEVRSARNERVLKEVAWARSLPEGTQLNRGDRCMQYRAVLISVNGDQYPVLEHVKVNTSR